MRVLRSCYERGVGGRVDLAGLARPPLCVIFWLLKIRSKLEVIGSFRCVPLLRWRECCSRHRGVSGRVCAWRRVSHELRGLLCLVLIRIASGR